MAAETSAAQYALGVIKRFDRKAVTFFGLGDSAMVAEGFQSLASTASLSVMGFWEVLPKYWYIRSVFFDLLKAVDENPPKVALLIDYPGFNLRLAKELKKRNIPVVYFVPPQVWVWKFKRIELLRQFADKLLVLFQFEKELYDRERIPCEFVGHPLAEEALNVCQLDLDWGLLRSRHGFRLGDRVLGLMPGSRRQEVEFNLPVQLQVARELRQRFPDLKICLLRAPSIEKEFLLQFHQDGFPVQVLHDEAPKMIGLCDCVLATSGTATLQIAMMEKPCVIMYRSHPFSAFIARRILRGKKIPLFGLPNILAGRLVCKERFQEEASVEQLVADVAELLENPVFSEQMGMDFRELKQQFKDSDAIGKIAKVVESYL